MTTHTCPELALEHNNELIALIAKVPSDIVLPLIELFKLSIFNDCNTMDINALEPKLREGCNSFMNSLIRTILILWQERIVEVFRSEQPGARCCKTTHFSLWTTYVPVSFEEPIFRTPECSYLRVVAPKLGLTNHQATEALQRAVSALGAELITHF